MGWRIGKIFCVLATTAAALHANTTPAVELRVDFGVDDTVTTDPFGATPNDVQAGYFDYSDAQNRWDDNGQIAMLELAGTSRVVSGVTVSIGVVPRVDDLSMVELFLMDCAVDAPGAMGDQVEDAAAALNGNLWITLSGLPAGGYQWTSYHHFPLLEFAWFGDSRITADVGGGPVTKINNVTHSGFSNPPASATFTFAVGPSGTATIELQAQSSFPAVTFINGFSLLPIPEPSTWTLLAIGATVLCGNRAARRVNRAILR